MYDYRGRDGTGTESNKVKPGDTGAQSYVVRKLADGNCWMSENLQLNLSATHSYKVGTFAGGEADWTPNQTSNGASFNYAITPFYGENIAITDYRGIPHNNWYYTWYGATAGQGTQTSNPSITQSICPKGWRLPKPFNNDKSFGNLVNMKYSLTTGLAINNDPLNIYPAGNISNNSGVTSSEYGSYWLDSSFEANYAYHVSYGKSSFNVDDMYARYGIKYNGLSVRCVSL